MQLIAVNGLRPPTNWQQVNWRQINRLVKNLRGRIFRATQAGEYNRVRNLQKLLLRSYANRLLSVRRVTQVNAGKNTAGIDKVLIKTAGDRSQLVDSLLGDPLWRAKPTRRIYIPKANGQQRPLGIPTIRDRVRQAMVKAALEPEWEAQFEGISYGFRPGRSCHDALAKLYHLCCPHRSKPWVLDADIKGCFDHINHDFLMKQIGLFPGRTWIARWLKAGYLERGCWHPSESGTPQGGVISPLLANIALHGMEAALGVRRNYRGQLDGSRYAVVRYADDFVVLSQTQADAYVAKAIVQDWLYPRGLSLCEEKTSIVHLQQGFDFLGCHIRHYPAPHTSRTGWKLLIKPSRQAIARVKARLKERWLAASGCSVRVVAKSLNPLIRGWASYYRPYVSSAVFSSLDWWMRIRQRRYLKRQHPHKSNQWCQQRYWGYFSLEHPLSMFFGDRATGVYLLQFSKFSIQRHLIVRGTASMDDPALKSYWQQRQAKAANSLKRSRQRIARQQNAKCPVCGDSLFNGEPLELHHRLPKSKGGKDTYDNLVFLHLYCHQQVHYGSPDGRFA